MVNTLLGMLRRWLGQDVARTNAAQASVRLRHHRRQLNDLDAYLAAQHHQSVQHDSNQPSTEAVHGSHPRHRPH
ncbi:MAG: hypothetical protein ACRDUV_10270 [Pseudonocardiaceae bacterium]